MGDAPSQEIGCSSWVATNVLDAEKSDVFRSRLYEESVRRISRRITAAMAWAKMMFRTSDTRAFDQWSYR